MATSTVQARKVSDAMSALLKAMGDEILPTTDELAKEGWVTAMEYADACRMTHRSAKARLDKSPQIEKRNAKPSNGRVLTMYRVRPQK